MDKYSLNPLTSDPRTFRIASFDVEGDGTPNGFVVGCIYDENGPQVYYDRDTMADALTGKRYRGYRLFAHNLEYDWGCLFQERTEGWQVYRLRSGVIKGIYRDGHKHSWGFYDSANLSAFQSLAALGRIIGLDKLETPDYIKLDGSTDRSRRELTPQELQELTRYCIRDAEIVFCYINRLQETINELGGQLGTTLASTAMDLFRRRFLLEPVGTPHEFHNEQLRPSYYGGRTEVFKYGRGSGLYQYDIHSLYPSVMSDLQLPDTGTTYFVNNTCKPSNIWRYAGITACRIRVPESYIPPLPVRINSRLLFPVGTFSGSWCHNELEYALEQGCEIESIDWQYIARTTINPFAGYVRELYNLKLQAQQTSDPSYFVYKILLNSLYGKFGQKCDGTFTKLVNISDVPNFLQKTGIDVIFWQGEGYISSPVMSKSQPPYVIVPWAAYITASARIAEHNLLSTYGDSVFYGDTDCAIGPWELPTDDKLGSLGLERGPLCFEFRAEKYYRCAATPSAWTYKKAGIPKGLQPDFWQSGKVQYPRPRKMGEAIRDDQPMSVWIKQVKSDLPRWTKRLILEPQNLPDGMSDTIPWTYEQAEEHYSSAPRFGPWRGGQITYSRLMDKAETAFLDSWIESSKLS